VSRSPTREFFLNREANLRREFEERTHHVFLRDWRSAVRPEHSRSMHGPTMAVLVSTTSAKSLGAIDPVVRPREETSYLSETVRRIVEMTE
jgi:hypothetical protein